ncbi:MAG: hypothetical protein J6J35_05375 [Alphaproteobacteria bacterium]|nr:hypothetical protein [Alphaproteobacteria bacterium]
MKELLLTVAFLIVLLFFVFKWGPNYLNECARKNFLKKYGKFIGKKGFIHPHSREFFDENKNLVEEVSGKISRCHGLQNNVFIPCTLVSGGHYLDIRIDEIVEKFEVLFVGENTVLKSPVYGEIVFDTEKLKTIPKVGDTISLELIATRPFTYVGWDLGWVPAET